MADDFSLSRDFRKIKWGATLKYNMLRATCAALTFILGGFIFQSRAANGASTLSSLVIAGLMIPIGYPLIFMPVGIALAFLGRFFSPFAFVAFCFGSMVAIGDPWVFFLHKLFRNFVPVSRPPFLSFRMLHFVFDDGSDSRIQQVADEQAQVSESEEYETFEP